jgi:proteasome lid subunit RPN8/RPN11
MNARARESDRTTTFRLPYREWRRLSRRAYRAQKRDHSEVCGLFATDGSQRLVLFFLANESARPGHFEVSWDAFRRTRKEIRNAGHRYLGLFHSHPISVAVPGAGDIRRAPVNSKHLIYDVCGLDARLWMIVRRGGRKRAVELPLLIERS